MAVNTASLLDFALRMHPAAPAFTDGSDAILSYADFDAQTTAFAGALQSRGLLPGDRIAMCFPPSRKFALTLFASWKAGLTVVPLNILSSEFEASAILSRSGAKMALFSASATTDAVVAAMAKHPGVIDYDVFAAEGLPGAAHPTRLMTSSDPRQPALVLYTSGTTSAPKGVRIPHLGLIMCAISTADALRMSSDDAVASALPLSHVFGLVAGLLAGLRAGADIHLIERFRPDTCLQTLHQARSTIFLGVPTMYAGLATAAGSLSGPLSLRIAASGGAPLDRAVSDRFYDAYAVRIVEGYGMTETSGVISVADPHDAQAIGTVGSPTAFVDIELRDENGERVNDGNGELWVRGPGIMDGYDNDAEETDKAMRDDWLRTGDVCRIDDAGRIVIVDRLKDMILRGGYNVYPSEVEAALKEHPAIAAIAVVGRPDPLLGEEIEAFVVLRAGAEETSDTLIEWARNRVARYKYPRRFVFCESLPTSPTGKILRRLLPRETATQIVA